MIDVLETDFLIQKYGKSQILDIGTGCGYLVKLLREKGCDAWGLEVSDYALENSCIPEFIRKGDIRNIPFAASSFDVNPTISWTVSTNSFAFIGVSITKG